MWDRKVWSGIEMYQVFIQYIYYPKTYNKIIPENYDGSSSPKSLHSIVIPLQYSDDHDDTHFQNNDLMKNISSSPSLLLENSVKLKTNIKTSLPNLAMATAEEDLVENQTSFKNLEGSSEPEVSEFDLATGSGNGRTLHRSRSTSFIS